jgi:hypothetical protein
MFPTLPARDIRRSANRGVAQQSRGRCLSHAVMPRARTPVDMWTTQERCPHTHRRNNQQPTTSINLIASEGLGSDSAGHIQATSGRGRVTRHQYPSAIFAPIWTAIHTRLLAGDRGGVAEHPRPRRALEASANNHRSPQFASCSSVVLHNPTTARHTMHAHGDHSQRVAAPTILVTPTRQDRRSPRPQSCWGTFCCGKIIFYAAVGRT